MAGSDFWPLRAATPDPGFAQFSHQVVHLLLIQIKMPLGNFARGALPLPGWPKGSHETTEGDDASHQQNNHPTFLSSWCLLIESLFKLLKGVCLLYIRKVTIEILAPPRLAVCEIH